MAVSAISFIVVGAGIVLPAWIAFHIGGSSLVGFVLVASTITGVCSAPFTGYLVDTLKRGHAALTGQILRGIGFCLLSTTTFAHPPIATVMLVLSSIFGATGFAILAGALNALLQAIVPPDARMAFVLRRSLVNQIGIALGTGAAGLAIDQLGALTTSLTFAVVAFGCCPLLILVARTVPANGTAARLPFIPATWDGLTYVLSTRSVLSASVLVALAFALIQVTNVLLPGFVVKSLGGDSQFFGSLEMAAAIAGAAAIVLASFPVFASRLQAGTPFLVIAAAASLVLFSITRSQTLALATYCLAGVLWSVARSAANATLLIVVPTAMIGRVQSLTGLLTAGIGLLVFLLPSVFSNFTEGHLYQIAGGLVILAATATSIATSRRVASDDNPH